VGGAEIGRSITATVRPAADTPRAGQIRQEGESLRPRIVGVDEHSDHVAVTLHNRQVVVVVEDETYHVDAFLRLLKQPSRTGRFVDVVA
jgi:hypothetical protein